MVNARLTNREQLGLKPSGDGEPCRGRLSPQRSIVAAERVGTRPRRRHDPYLLRVPLSVKLGDEFGLLGIDEIRTDP